MFNLLTPRIINLAIDQRIANSEYQLTIRNVIDYLDFDISVTQDKITYKNKKDEDKIIIIYQLSYVPRDANPTNAVFVKRPYSVTITRNDNLVYSIQMIQSQNQELRPVIEINKHDKVSVAIEGYDGTANIYLFGLVAERMGTNVNY